MQWHDMIVLKTLFLKELVSKSAILNEVIDFEIKQFWNQTFFSTLSRAQLGKPDWSRILTESQKSSQQNSAVFHTRQYSGTHYARFVNFLSWNCLSLKVNRNMFFILEIVILTRHFFSKFIHILTISGQISLKPTTVYGSANSILREQRTKSQSFKVEQKN